MLALEMLLLLKNINIRLFTTCPLFPRSNAFPESNPFRSFMMWQSSVCSVLEGEAKEKETCTRPK